MTIRTMTMIAAVGVAACACAEFAGRDPRYPGFAEENFKMPMRVMVIGAHPDDADFECGATAIKLARAGARVQFVSVCNGNKGHQTMSSPDLAARRAKEAQAAAKIYGVEKYTIIGEPDCEVEPTLALRAKITKLIREFAPHAVFTHRPTDYHADHRATGTAVLDAIYMLGVPLYCPDAPVPEMLPFVMYTGDGFTLPRPFRADMIVAVDDVRDQLVEGFACHVSQVFEWLPPEHGFDPKKLGSDHASRIAYVKAHHMGRTRSNGRIHRAAIEKAFGANAPEFVDVYELSEYGRKPCKKELAFLKSLGFKWMAAE